MATAINPNVARKHKEAIKEFDRLSNLKEEIGGKFYKKHPQDYCLAKAAYKFYMSPRTLEDVLYR